MHSGAAQKLLGHVLYSVARLNPDVGYCQGMNFVAAVMILTSLSSRLQHKRKRQFLGDTQRQTDVESEMFDSDPGLSNEVARVGGVASPEMLEHLYRMCEDEEGGSSGSNDGGSITWLIT
eukprot:g1743.t1